MSRDEVLANVRRALGRAPEQQRPIAEPPEAKLPPRPSLEGDLVDRFRRESEAVATFVLEGGDAWGMSLRRFLEEEGLVGVYAPGLDKMDGLEGVDRVGEERARDEPGRVLGLARADWGVAASGSVVVEGARLLPLVLVETAMVVLSARSIVASLADLPPPKARRLVVTGPSRTADIEKKIVLGAHGPKRFGVLLVP